MLIYLQMIETEEDRSKFIAIYEAYSDMMFHIANSALRHRQDAEDVVAWAFEKIARNIKKVRPVGEDTRSYVTIMVEHKVTDILRKRCRHPDCEYNDQLHHALQEAPCENFLSQCMLELPGRERTVMWLKYHYGFELCEIAKMLDISVGWAYKLHAQAKKDLNKLYTEGGGVIL